MAHSQAEREREEERHRGELALERSKHAADLQSERAKHVKEQVEHVEEQQRAMEEQRVERGRAAEVIGSLNEEVSRLRGDYEAASEGLEEERRERKQLERALDACTAQLARSREDGKRLERAMGEQRVEAARREEAARAGGERMEGEASGLRVAVAVRGDRIDVGCPATPRPLFSTNMHPFMLLGRRQSGIIRLVYGLRVLF